MGIVLAFAAAILATLGGGFLYLASPNQRLMARPGPARRNLLLGAAANLGALLALLQITGPGTATFILLTVLTAVLTAAPFLAVFRPRRK